MFYCICSVDDMCQNVSRKKKKSKTVNPHQSMEVIRVFAATVFVCVDLATFIQQAKIHW